MRNAAHVHPISGVPALAMSLIGVVKTNLPTFLPRITTMRGHPELGPLLLNIVLKSRPG